MLATASGHLLQRVELLLFTLIMVLSIVAKGRALTVTQSVLVLSLSAMARAPSTGHLQLVIQLLGTAPSLSIDHSATCLVTWKGCRSFCLAPVLVLLCSPAYNLRI
jgi:hypothetical protein